MLHTFGLRHRTTRAFAGAAAGLLLLTGTVAACPTDLRDMGMNHVQGGGFWGYEVNTRDNVIAAGYNFGRVTDGNCNNPSPSAIVFEANLEPTHGGDGAWAGLLTPVGSAAERLANQPGFEGQVHLEPAGSGTHVSSYLQGMPQGRNFRLCLGIDRTH